MFMVHDSFMPARSCPLPRPLTHFMVLVLLLHIFLTIVYALISFFYYVFGLGDALMYKLMYDALCMMIIWCMDC
ncbi:hypothetical protein GALMADRAFT_683808 [Galerina marginata CBS 339.88]|uniref:Uncharacterized protein n=1 Tax=Galerina marginata (strain CBS 339.88) TaxID=685588 RepID=A0A067TL77_GALM3|nr:hypothetical protein GALMADRAFT_683808 [Galerina marginata CBS 339.88]